MLSALLIRLFIKNHEQLNRPDVRLAYGILSGITGIAVNVLLFVIKITVGIASGSIAIAADAVNNLSDAGSAVITVVGFKLSSRPADSDHPFGHGRVEYIAGVIVSIIILAVGVDFLKESITGFFAPAKLHISNQMLLVVTGTLLFKLWLFFFYRKIGKMIDSKVVIASAFDSLSDILCTSAVIVAVFCGRFTTFPVDAAAGTLVALLIIFGGIKTLRETINPLLGECPTPELVDEMRQLLLSCDGINGVHDIIIHNYGPNQIFATAHAEIEQDGTLMAAHDLLEKAEIKVASCLQIRLLLHCDPCNISDPEVIRWRGAMEEIVSAFDCRLKLYDFRLGFCGNKLDTLHFHLLIPRNHPMDNSRISDHLTHEINKINPDLKLAIEFISSFV